MKNKIDKAQLYAGRPAREVTEQQIAAMSEEEFEALILAVDDGPLIILSVDPDTGEERRAVVVPLSVMTSLLENVVASAT